MDRKQSDSQITYDGDLDDSWRRTGWAELPFFLAVARAGTFRAAAERLKVNHATVDRHIRALEEAYNVRLFDRKARGVTLTAAGRNLLDKAEDAERTVLNAKRTVSGMDAKLQGEVRLNISSWNACYMLASNMPRFHELYPDIDLKVSVSDRVEDLAKSPSDVSYRGAWSIDEDVVARKIYNYSAAVLASQDYIDRHWKNREPNGEGLHWIGKSALWPNPRLDYQTLFPAAKRRNDILDPILINEMMKEGQGMAVMPFCSVFLIPGLTVVPGTPVVRDRTVWVLLQSDLRHTARVRAVVEFLYDMGKAVGKKEKQYLSQAEYVEGWD